MTERLHFHFSLWRIGEGNGNPLHCSCLENPRDGGAWWAAIYGVAQSRTRLKRLSSSNHTAVEFLAGVSPHINKEVSGRIRKIESRLWTSSISQVSIRLLKKLVVGSNLHVFWKSMSLFLNLLTNFCYYQTLKLFQSLKWYLIILFSIFWFVSKF